MHDLARIDGAGALRENSHKRVSVTRASRQCADVIASLDWSYLAPSQNMKSGQRTGQFRLGGDQLLTDATGRSSISVEDFAVAMIDELEHPAHIRQRFTVGY